MTYERWWPLNWQWWPWWGQRWWEPLYPARPPRPATMTSDDPKPAAPPAPHRRPLWDKNKWNNKKLYAFVSSHCLCISLSFVVVCHRTVLVFVSSSLLCNLFIVYGLLVSVVVLLVFSVEHQHLLCFLVCVTVFFAANVILLVVLSCLCVVLLSV